MSEIATIPIRYDGLDAEQHEIELLSLGESMQGMARVLGVLTHFALTGKHARQMAALDVRVVAKEPRANCFTFNAVLQFAQQHGILQGGAGAIVAALVAWAIARSSNNKDEMKLLHQSLNNAVEVMAGSHAATVERMMALLETVVESLRPALRQAVEPIGKTCLSMTIAGTVRIDESAAEAIRKDEPDEIADERVYSVRITELDLENATAKVRLDGDEADNRVRAVITDPGLAMTPNPYLSAFTAQGSLPVVAKATLRAGSIVTLFVSNAGPTLLGSLGK